MKVVELFADGACDPNPGVGGWGFVLRVRINGSFHRKEGSGSIPESTNNRSEIIAVLEGLRAIKEPCEVHVYSDSQYVIKGATGQWGRKKNRDLWNQLMSAAKAHHVNWNWIRGHAGHPENERCDRLANRAIRHFRKQQLETA